MITGVDRETWVDHKRQSHFTSHTQKFYDVLNPFTSVGIIIFTPSNIIQRSQRRNILWKVYN